MRNATAKKLRRLAALTATINPKTHTRGYYRQLKREWVAMSVARRRKAGPAIDRTILQFEALVDTFAKVKEGARAGQGNATAAKFLGEAAQ